MACAIRHSENAIFHMNMVRKTLNSHRDVFKFLKKDSVKVLDVGCGSGKVFLEELLPILPKNFTELIGIDKNDSMIEHCRSYKVEPRVSFQLLDITTSDLPEKFLGKFDLITSFYCLHYAKDYDRMLQNIYSMLKPNGELLYIQAYNLNPVYHTYKELSKMDTWKKFFKDFENYECPFAVNDPEMKLKKLLHDAGLNLLRHKFESRSIELIPKNFIESLKSFDTKMELIPLYKRKKYNRDFHQCFSKLVNLDFVSETGLNRKSHMHFDQLTVYAVKN